MSLLTFSFTSEERLFPGINNKSSVTTCNQDLCDNLFGAVNINVRMGMYVLVQCLSQLVPCVLWGTSWDRFPSDQ